METSNTMIAWSRRDTTEYCYKCLRSYVHTVYRWWMEAITGLVLAKPTAHTQRMKQRVNESEGLNKIWFVCHNEHWHRRYWESWLCCVRLLSLWPQHTFPNIYNRIDHERNGNKHTFLHEFSITWNKFKIEDEKKIITQDNRVPKKWKEMSNIVWYDAVMCLLNETDSIHIEMNLSEESVRWNEWCLYNEYENSTILRDDCP